MADTHKILAQYNPPDNVLNTVYTVPASTRAYISSIWISYRYDSLNLTRFMALAVVESGGTPGNKHWLIKDETIPRDDTYIYRCGVTLGAGDTIRFQVSTSGAGSFSVNVFGFETDDTNYKILGQLDATANTLTEAYVVPASVHTVLSGIAICNRNATVQTCRLAVRTAADAGSDLQKQYILNDLSMPPNTAMHIQPGISLATGDKIFFRHNGGVVLSLFGGEYS
jgi:hypothetical protein